MGNNSAYTAFETSVILCAKRGVLDKKLLADLMEPYRDMDIDSGGKVGTVVKFKCRDGIIRKLEVEDVVINVFTGKYFEPPKLPKKFLDWSDAEQKLNDDYQERRSLAFNRITDRFGWY
jgi:hypothetical protein